MNLIKAELDTLKNKFHSYRSIIENLGYLTCLQVLNMILPLLTYPYLIKILDTETYGIIIYAQAIVSYFSVIINFGFNITATKEISIYKHDNKKISEVASSVYIIKACLLVMSFLLMSLLIAFSLVEYEFITLYYLSMWMCVYEFAFPIWYFQGIEKMKYITFLSVGSRLFFLLLIFILVKQKDDYLLVPIINGFGAIISCIISFLIISNNGVVLKWQTYVTIKKYIKLSYIMALAYSVNLFKTNFNLIIAKVLFSYSEVVYFDIALKIVNISTSFLDLISQAIFPRISRTKDNNLLQKVMKLALIISCIMVVILQIFSPLMVKTLSNVKENDAVFLTRILALNLPVYTIGALIGRNCLIVYGYNKEVLLSMVYSAVFYFLVIYACSLLKIHLGLEILAFVYLFSFLVETLYRYRVCRSHNLLRL